MSDTAIDEQFHPHDVEDCPSCAARSEPCPYHQGVGYGVDLMADAVRGAVPSAAATVDELADEPALAAQVAHRYRTDRPESIAR